jgi:hypothetical protein
MSGAGMHLRKKRRAAGKITTYIIINTIMLQTIITSKGLVQGNITAPATSSTI